VVSQQQIDFVQCSLGKISIQNVCFFTNYSLSGTQKFLMAAETIDIYFISAWKSKKYIIDQFLIEQ